MTPDACRLTVLMPCLDEAETLAVCIDKAMASIERLGITGEVLIADNGSTDGSQAIARERGARVVDVEARGYGAALIGGIEAARGRWVIMADADDSYDLERLDPFVDALEAGADFVIGNRFKGGIEKGAMPPLHKIGNPVLTFVGRVLFKVPSKDFHCGMRAFDRDKVLALGLSSTGMEFASEMLVKASLNQLDIVEVPTRLFRDGRTRSPHLRTWRDGWRHLRFLLLLSPRWLFIYPGLVMALVGAVFGAVLMTGSITVAGVTFASISLLGCALLVIAGSQLVLLGLAARVLADAAGLLPATPGSTRMVAVVDLDRLVVIGSALFATGLAVWLAAAAWWAFHGFDDLDLVEQLRLLVPGAALLVVGLETAATGFLVGIARQVTVER